MHLQALRLIFGIVGIRTPGRAQPLRSIHRILSLQATESRTLREKIKDDLPLLEKGSLRDCQFEAITNLETSLKEAHLRALIQMATGSGKTHAAVSAVYRLIRFAGAKRVLFLVDRRNLGRQTLREFQAYTAPDDGRKFTELYNVQHLSSNVIDQTSLVCITTLQRLYSMLKGEPECEMGTEEASTFENDTADTSPQPVTYNPKIPINTFKDNLFTDLFPNRRIVPKTLIFAKDDSHAEDIVHVVRDVFTKGDEFCQKITYQSDKPEELIAKFRTDPIFRIAVSVDMISTGTDIKPLECFLFMRAVRSSGYFEQMKGRGVRTINRDDLLAVPGDATEKTHFFIVDAVGVCETAITDSQPLPGAPPSAEPTPPTETDSEQLIDELSEDRVLRAGFDTERSTHAITVIQTFKQFIKQNCDELSALQILCNRPGVQVSLTENTLNELEESLKKPPNTLTREALWFAYHQVSPVKVRGSLEQRTDIISLIRFAIGESAFLEPFRVTVNRRFKEWLIGQDFTPEQRLWLEMIRDHIATSLDIRMSDFEYAPFAERGNGARVYRLFGDDLDDILTSLTEKLVS